MKFFKNNEERKFGYSQFLNIILFLIIVWLISVNYARAQILDPLSTQMAYITADPNNEDRLGLATLDGRYSIKLSDQCQGIEVGQNVVIFPYLDIPPWLSVMPIGGDPYQCHTLMYGRMSDIPCFKNQTGECDIAAEYE